MLLPCIMLNLALNLVVVSGFLLPYVYTILNETKSIVCMQGERRMLLEVIGDINAAALIYHWVISCCHNRFGAILGSDLYMKVIGVTPKDEEGFEWIINKDSDIFVSITALMVCFRTLYIVQIVIFRLRKNCYWMRCGI